MSLELNGSFRVEAHWVLSDTKGLFLGMMISISTSSVWMYANLLQGSKKNMEICTGLKSLA